MTDRTNYFVKKKDKPEIEAEECRKPLRGAKASDKPALIAACLASPVTEKTLEIDVKDATAKKKTPVTYSDDDEGPRTPPHRILPLGAVPVKGASATK